MERKTVTYIVAGATITVLALGSLLYKAMDSLSQKFAHSEIFSKNPIRKDLGTKYYTTDELGDLVNMQIPIRLVKNDSSAPFPNGAHWSNNPNYESDNPHYNNSSLERVIGRLFPTHIMYFTRVGNEYKMEIKPIG